MDGHHPQPQSLPPQELFAAGAVVPRLAERGRGRRYPWVDFLKASGILAVIWIHAFSQLEQEQPLLIQRLATLSRFAVPGFFLASGFLQAVGRRMSAREFLAHRLRRLLGPYLVASVVAIVFRIVLLDESFDLARVARMLVLGDAWGVYYFVPLLIVFSAIGELAFRVPRLAWPAWIGLTILGVLAYQLHFYAGSFAAELRNPLRWWGWFCGGWVLAVSRDQIDGLGPVGRRAAGGTLLAAVAACYAAMVLLFPPGWSPTTAALEYLLVEGLLFGTALLAWQGSPAPLVRWLSAASYPIYLQHYFVMVVLQRLAGWQDRPLVVFITAVPVTIAIVRASAWACGSWAGLIIGVAPTKPPGHPPDAASGSCQPDASGMGL